MLLDIQIKCQIYNTDIEPEHESSEFMACTCEIHQYRQRKVARLDVQEMWSKAVMYPGSYRHLGFKDTAGINALTMAENRREGLSRLLPVVCFLK